MGPFLRQQQVAVLVDQIPVGVVIADLYGNFRDCNQEACRIFGIALEEIQGRNIADVTHPDDAHYDREDFRQLIAGKKHRVELVKRFQRPNAELVWCKVLVRQLRQANHEKPFLLATIEDITEEQQLLEQREKVLTELEKTHRVAVSLMQDAVREKNRAAESLERLEESEAKMRGIIANMADAVITIDYQGRVQQFSKAAEKMFGYSAEHMIGQSVNRLMPPSYTATNYKDLKPFLNARRSAGSDKDKEILAQRADGSVFPGELSVAELTIQGERIFTGIIRDITERKRYEQELTEARNAAEAASDAKSRFLATMSHELRTPMNGVVGMLDLLTQSELSGEQRKLTTVARNSAMALLQIINDILDFSKIEAGKLLLESIPLLCGQLLEGVAELLSQECRNKNLQLYCFADPACTKPLMGDPLRLRQILLNLLGNAIKFTYSTPSAQGVIVARFQPLKGPSGAPWLRLSVKDNGIGISASEQKTLFQPFTQADDTTQRQFGGTGLGLSICSRLVELMGGRIGFHSEKDHGSEFYVELPAPPAEPKYGYDPNTPGLQKLAIGLCMTDEIARDYLVDYLTQQGADVGSMHISGADSLAEKGNQVDILVVDQEVFFKHRSYFDHTYRKPLLILYDITRVNPSDFPVRAIGIESNPFLPNKVHHGIGVALGLASPLVENQESIPKLNYELPSIEAAEQQGSLVLIVEDNLSNQEVMKRQVNLFGYVALVADNGQEALKLLEQRYFGLVITDCHMPIMDGFELTKTIRRREKQSSTGRLPIVAATANALQGEADRCFDIGMDDFITKPISLKSLQALLHAWLPEIKTARGRGPAKRSPKCHSHRFNEPSAPKGNSDTYPIDIGTLNTYLGADQALHREILNSFLRQSEPDISALRRSTETEDWPALVSLAHKLKSSAKLVGANDLAEALRNLEAAGKQRNTKSIQDLSQQVVQEYQRVMDFIRSNLMH